MTTRHTVSSAELFQSDKLFTRNSCKQSISLSEPSLSDPSASYKSNILTMISSVQLSLMWKTFCKGEKTNEAISRLVRKMDIQ